MDKEQWKIKYKDDEWFDIVTEDGVIIDKAPRTICHNKTFLLHPVVHLHLFNSKGELFLQKRSPNKKIQPNKWDTAVGGHVDSGEDIRSALIRESFEELGIKDFIPEFIGRYTFRSEVEYELVHIYRTVCDQKINIDHVEISEGRFWSLSDIERNLNADIFTPNFVQEYQKWKNKIISDR